MSSRASNLQRLSGLLAGLALMGLLSCGGSSSGNSEINIPFVVDGNGDFVVPAELSSDYARWRTDSTAAYSSLPGSLNLRKAYVYWTFNQNDYVTLDRLDVDLLASSADEHDVLVSGLAKALGGSSDGGNFRSLVSPTEEDYVISFGGDIAMDRLFQMAIYTLETYPGETLLVGPEVGLILPAGN